ncbi:hypothetical protein [Helicobacter sp. 13S00477-4]|uniref:hypothetical protein n=1 Tax=Helicobacter sp. 13S00477-4 TaxID=1905759 RepID=UPI000BA557AF|nr:hypothetical protein [Helicobacter sp. 13S00477-4]PAF51990.1 hypothetical protein BKH44_04840 [Helicobacter sp. 13S00477-4]
MEFSTLASVAGWSVGAVSLCVTFMAVFVAIYAIFLQRSMSKKLKEEIIQKADKKLNKALEEPAILEKFIKAIIASEDFRTRIASMVDIQIENILDSRATLEDKNLVHMVNEDIINKFNSKKEDK